MTKEEKKHLSLELETLEVKMAILKERKIEIIDLYLERGILIEDIKPFLPNEEVRKAECTRMLNIKELSN